MDLNSDDLLVILALCREGTLEGAAAALGKDPSSVFRAIKRIEAKVSQPLFARSRTGFEAFEVATVLAEKGRVISEALSFANNLTSEADATLRGRLRVTTTDLLLERYILPNLKVFREKHPELELDFTTDNKFSKLWERDVDIAFRPSDTPPEQMIGQKLSTIGYRIGFSPDHIWPEGAEPGDIYRAHWLVPGGEIHQHSSRKWFSANITSPASVISFDSMCQLVRAVEMGQGVALLPALEPVMNKLEVSDIAVEAKTELWTLFHPSNKNSPRIQAFSQFLRQITR